MGDIKQVVVPIWPTGHHLLTPELNQGNAHTEPDKQDFKFKRRQLASVRRLPPTEEGPMPTTRGAIMEIRAKHLEQKPPSGLSIFRFSRRQAACSEAQRLLDQFGHQSLASFCCPYSPLLAHISQQSF